MKLRVMTAVSIMVCSLVGCIHDHHHDWSIMLQKFWARLKFKFQRRLHYSVYPSRLFFNSCCDIAHQENRLPDPTLTINRLPPAEFDSIYIWVLARFCFSAFIEMFSAFRLNNANCLRPLFKSRLKGREVRSEGG